MAKSVRLQYAPCRSLDSAQVLAFLHTGARMLQASLPIYAIADDLVAACATESRLLLTAPTGSGKSTQVPQILLDRGVLGDG